MTTFGGKLACPDAGTGLLIVMPAAPANAVVTGHPSSWSTAGIERQVGILGGGPTVGQHAGQHVQLWFCTTSRIAPVRS
jgi:hypothetical protein